MNLFFLLILGLALYSKAEGPQYRHKESEKQLEFENVYQDLRQLKSSISTSSTSFSSSSAKLQSLTSTGTYCDQLGGSSNGLECFVNGVLILSFLGNGDFELFPSTAASSVFLQGVLSSNKPILQGRPTTNPWDLGSSTNKWASISLSSGVVGTTTNDNAPTGYYGEYVSSTMASVDVSVSGGSGGWQDYGTITLTAGDWDLTGQFVWRANGATVTDVEIGISNTSGATFSDQVYGTNTYNNLKSFGATETNWMTLSNYRVSLNSTVTYYLKFQATYAAATPVIRGGKIEARRAR